MRPIVCAGGYPIPFKKGKWEIFGVVATVSDTTQASRLSLIDTDAFSIIDDSILTKKNEKHFIDLKGLANADGVIGCMFSEPIKVVNGISIDEDSTNLIAGRTFVYVR